MIKLVIFDASGTLLNDFAVTWKAVSKILVHFGKQADDLITFRKNFRFPYWNYFVNKGIEIESEIGGSCFVFKILYRADK